MRFVRPILVVLSSIILAAHFMRSGDILPMLVSLLLPALLLLRHNWAVRVVQLGLLFGAIEWVRTTILLIQERQALGQSWDRLALILGLVALLTACSALLLRAPTSPVAYPPQPIPQARE
jgi:hypothetical protein